jgi:ATP-dependent helicase HrpA
LAQTRLAVELPEIEYPAELPVSQYRAQIEAALATNQVVIVAGETGSGKTTQIPKILLEMGRGRVGQIGHTQPRRIAARSVAERIAWELGTPLGEVVGYQVRFTDESSERTLVKVMTDGILLASLARDPKLLAYDTIIIDEAHERSLNIDFLLGYLARLLPFRPDLKLVITSSTIDSEKFASHFSPANLAKVAGAEPIVVSALPAKAPIIEVEGRTYPVEIRYRPLEETRNNKTIDKDIITGIVEACDELMNEGPGDILVFLSGEREIRDAATALTGHLGNLVTDPNIYGGVEIVPLFARLSAAEQHRVFSPGGKRRIILATNVAETSLTVPGIHYVVDTGLARISRYSKASKVQRLPIESISQASANQRSGRSGRITNGIAIRLYSEADFEQRSEFTEPEILRTSLASVILQMLAVGVVSKPDEIAQFPFVQAPDTKAIRDGVVLLRELGALATDNDDEGILTEIGRQLSTLPMDPRLARMVIAGVKNGVGNQVAVITAALSIQDPRERPEDFRDAADLLHNRFLFPSSDFLTLLNLWNYIREQQNELSSSAFRRLCKAEYLHYLRIREWQDLVSQIKAMAQDIGMRFDKPQLPFEVSKDSDIIHKSLLTGLLSNIGMQDTLEIKASAVAHLRGEKRALALRQAAKRARNEYRGARGIRFTIFPGSPVSKHPPHWIMASELVETSRLWARQVAKINPEWIESLAQHQVRRTYSDPHWSTKQGAALATEKVLLYGLPIVTNRKVQYGKIDAPAAREMFIRHALVYGEWHWRDKFYTHNQEFLSNLEKLAARSRQRQTSLSEEYLFEFYDSRLPESITSAGAFDYWWKKARISNPELLNLSQQDLATPELDHHDYPDFWHQGDLVLPLSYELSPGSDSDGVTVHLTASQLEVVEKGGFDWLVPGMLPELSIATVRALPKDLRVQLVPAPDTGKAVAQWLQAHKPPWVQITSAGNSGEPFAVAYSQALAAVRGIVVEPSIIAEATANLPTHLKMRFQTPDKAVELPELVATRPKPEVVAAASQVDLREELLQQLQLPTARITSRWTPKQALALAASPYATTEALVQDLQRAAIIEILSAATGNLTNLLGQPAATLANPSPELTATIKQDLEDTTYRIAADVAAGLAAGRELDVALRAANSLALLATASQIREQMSQLVFPGFIAATPAAQLRSLARYLTAATYRLEKAATSVARDQDLAHRISSFEKELGPENAAAAKWLLQELRVSYFAQHLGTSEAISEKRIRKSLQA